MASVSGALIWEIVKKNNAFFGKQFGNSTANVQFSKEKNNLYNVNSFKHSGLANKKTVSIQPAGDGLSVVLAATKTRKQRKRASVYHKSVIKKEFKRMTKAVVNQILTAKGVAGDLSIISGCDYSIYYLWGLVIC